jgi:penicillin amidase
VVFTTWYSHLYRLAYDELYLHPDSNKLIYPENWVTVELMSKQAAHPVFDDKTTTAVVETASDLVAAAWEKTTEELGGTYHTESCTWALHQQATVAHLARLQGMGSSTLMTGGFKDAPNAQTRTNGPSWRFVVELSTPVKSWGVYPGGQSGNPGSPHYQTGLTPWVEGQYFDLLFLTDESAARAKSFARVWDFQ